MNTKNSNTADIEGIRASLSYLSFEAEGAGLSEVASMLQQAAQRCDQKEAEQKPVETLADSETIKAIDFLYLFYGSSRESKECFLEYVDVMSQWLSFKVRTSNENTAHVMMD